MKVLNIIKTADGAGWALRQNIWLSQNGVEVVAILPFDDRGMALEYKKYGIRVIKADLSIPITKPWLLLKRTKIARKLIELEKPDIIHCHFVTNAMFMRLALGKNHHVPRVFQVPGPLHLENFLYRKAEIFTAGKADYWAGSCKRTCEIYKENGISIDRIFLCYYGGNIKERCLSQKKTGKLRSEYGIDDRTPLVGMVAFFYKPKWYLLQNRGIKGHEDFIDAIAIVKQDIPEVKGIIIGGPWGNSEKYEECVKRYAAKKCGDRIIFTGYRSDVFEIYKDLDVAVHPSLSENLGGAGESLTFEVPTISTDIGGFPDIVIDGETGYTIPPKSAEKLAKAIIKIIRKPDDAKMVAKKGRQLVTGLLDIEITGATVLNMYNKILYGDK